MAESPGFPRGVRLAYASVAALLALMLNNVTLAARSPDDYLVVLVPSVLLAAGALTIAGIDVLKTRRILLAVPIVAVSMWVLFNSLARIGLILQSQ